MTGRTRPDVAFESCQIANYGKNHTVQHLKDANKAVRKLKSKNITIIIPKITELHHCRIVCYTDATHASLKSGASQGGYIVFLEKDGICIPICWQSRNLQRVTKSSLASNFGVKGGS